jgi:plasmid stabilization system protein ParE
LTRPASCAAVFFLPAAAAQVEAIAESYAHETATRATRPEAVRKLREAVTEAVAALLTGRIVRRRYPAIYEEMALAGEEWLRVHRYWFGYVRDGDQAVVFAVLEATGDMPARR